MPDNEQRTCPTYQYDTEMVFGSNISSQLYLTLPLGQTCQYRSSTWDWYSHRNERKKISREGYLVIWLYAENRSKELSFHEQFLPSEMGLKSRAIHFFDLHNTERRSIPSFLTRFLIEL